LSPTVEPFVVVGYAMFYFAPFFPAVWVLRKLQARRPPESFVWRRPLLSLAALILVIGFVFDMLLEVSPDLGIHVRHVRDDSRGRALLSR
jgi:hypothetical protein